MKYGKIDLLKFISGYFILFNMFFLLSQDSNYYYFILNFNYLNGFVLLFSYPVALLFQVLLQKIFPTKKNKHYKEKLEDLIKNQRIIFMKSAGVNFGIALTISILFMIIKFILVYDISIIICMIVFNLLLIPAIYLNRRNLEMENK